MATPSALEALDQRGVSPLDLLQRHASGDWGEVCKADVRENQRSLKHGLRVLSSYPANSAKNSAPYGCSAAWQKPRKFPDLSGWRESPGSGILPVPHIALRRGEA